MMEVAQRTFMFAYRLITLMIPCFLYGEIVGGGGSNIDEVTPKNIHVLHIITLIIPYVFFMEKLIEREGVKLVKSPNGPNQLLV